jgi:penicillin-binding protein 2
MDSDLDETFNRLLQLLPELRVEVAESFKQRLRRTARHRVLSLPLVLSEQDAARFAVQSYLFPGVTLNARLRRVYPYESSAVHALGYVGRISQQDLQRLDANRYRGTDITGKAGIERYYEDRLQGFPGLQRVETNAQGRVIRVLETIPPTSGQDVVLTLDIRLQRFVEGLLKERRGSLVALDPTSGAILALVSSPTYDPNWFVDGISHAQYNELLNDRRKPLINRALNGQYPPGSTTKPFLGLGALEQGFISKGDRIFDPGYFEFQDRRYRNWRREGHGWTDLKRSLVESVDTLYYKMSLDIGIDGIHDMLAPFGFGKPTGIDLQGESSGILPSQAWKREVHGLPWYRGETIISSIGQGYNLVTPLQLAKTTAALANRGRVVTPHLFQGFISSEETQIPIKDRSHWEYIIDGMIDSVHTPRGTAWGAGKSIRGYKIAGKTGTAQVFSLNDAEYNEEELDKRLHDHSLFIAFAPAQRPKIALGVIVENAGGGGRVAAPIGIETIDFYLKKMDEVKP